MNSSKPNGPVLTCLTGSNSDLLSQVIRLYLPEGSRIADVTFGLGMMWKTIDTTKYTLVGTDIKDGTDFTRLPYGESEFDAVLLDPPYMHGGHDGTAYGQAMSQEYSNRQNSHEAVIRMYLAASLEAHRVLRKKGIFMVKCQPEIESGRQQLTHVQLYTVLPMIGFRVEDEFVLHQEGTPTMRQAQQTHARKNHSYMIVASKRR